MGQGARVREYFSDPFGRETVRAFVLFGLLLSIIAGVGVRLVFQDLSRMALAHLHDLGVEEARRIAESVAALGRDARGIDVQRLREKIPALDTLIRERMAERGYVRHVEVLDQAGGRILFVGRDSPPWRAGLPSPLQPEDLGLGSPDEQVVRVQLKRGARPAAEVRVGISEEQIVRDVENLRRSLRLKAAAAGIVGVLALVLALFYVLHLLRKNRRLEQQRQAADRRAEVGLLASGLAHEIRNPLNAMNMNLQMLEEELTGIAGLADTDHRVLLSSTKGEIKRLERLVNNFLAYARPAVPRFEARDLNAVLEDVVRFLQADFRQNSVNLTLDAEPLLPTVEIDETQFKQALMNLLVNARQILRSGGSVTLRSRAGAGGEAIVEVEDDGPGIDPEDRERVFAVFYSERGGGTGLGLPIAKQIVERHGGRIEIDSAKSRGAVFRIRLPRRHPKAPPSSAGPGAAP